VASLARAGRVRQRGASRAEQRFAEKKFRPLRLHDMRRTFATLAIEGGRSIMWVSKVLGHQDPSLTLRTYAHMLDRAER
jgi:integrase